MSIARNDHPACSEEEVTQYASQIDPLHRPVTAQIMAKALGTGKNIHYCRGMGSAGEGVLKTTSEYSSGSRTSTRNSNLAAELQRTQREVEEQRREVEEQRRVMEEMRQLAEQQAAREAEHRIIVEQQAARDRIMAEQHRALMEQQTQMMTWMQTMYQQCQTTGLPLPTPPMMPPFPNFSQPQPHPHPSQQDQGSHLSDNNDFFNNLDFADDC